MWIERNGEKVEKDWTLEEFNASSLPVKGWVISTPPEPVVYTPTIYDQIAALEMEITPRMQREALLGSTLIDARTGRTARQQIAYIDEQIAALRALL